MIEFNVVNNLTSKITGIEVDSNQPKKFTVGYKTCDSQTLSGKHYDNYSISIYEGLSSPTQREPVEVFHNISASSKGASVNLESKFNLLSGLYIIALSVGSNSQRTLTSFVKLVRGNQSAEFSSSVNLENILATQTGFELDVHYQILSGMNPEANRDRLTIYNISDASKLMASHPVDSPMSEGVCKVQIDTLAGGEVFTIGYYLGNILGACAAKQEIVVSNIS